MPAKIPLSAVKALDFDFDAAVMAYRQALADFGARPADWAPIPPPVAPHPLVALAAAVPTYEIHDDTPPPPPPPSLEQRKRALADEIESIGAAALARLLPPLKRPLLDLQWAKAVQTPEDQRSQAQRDVINNRRGIDEQRAEIHLQVATLLDRIHDMDEETFEAFEKKPRPRMAE